MKTNVSISVPAVIKGLAEVAKEREFPKSLFALEVVMEWYLSEFSKNGDLDPEDSPEAAVLTEHVGLSFQAATALYQQVMRTELDRCMARADEDVLAFAQASCLVYGRFIHDDALYCEWRLWSGYNSADLVTLPRSRSPFSDANLLPFDVVSLITMHPARIKPRSLDIEINDYESLIKTYFETHSDRYIVPSRGW